MSRNKLRRFEENARMPHVVQPDFVQLSGMESFYLKDHWQEFFPAGGGPVTLELGCGAGEYTLAMARLFPDRRFIGIDKKGARLWRGARISLEEKLGNVAFLRLQGHLIDRVFGPRDQVHEIWLPFPDPQPGLSRARKRLTHPAFLERYRKFCHPDAVLHLKTDNSDLMAFTLEVIKQQQLGLFEYYSDVHRQLPEDHLLRQVITKYEAQFLSAGRIIQYVQFSLFPQNH
ncbi:MAG: tRNA (guanosine(46)-N7)-methyltransferase TrmB [Flavobacteriales bacterium]|nr:tRNA (guanosine(46)-N7)-methyltransferase TrmB [Flavobacteriales bacterium]MDW8431806.1 tRNA (guanosine(46)-N7)-methyltransferase TrmB [Flavobacteriales bacterium]